MQFIYMCYKFRVGKDIYVLIHTHTLCTPKYLSIDIFIYHSYILYPYTPGPSYQVGRRRQRQHVHMHIHIDIYLYSYTFIYLYSYTNIVFKPLHTWAIMSGWAKTAAAARLVLDLSGTPSGVYVSQRTNRLPTKIGTISMVNLVELHICSYELLLYLYKCIYIYMRC
jgi:hypothetical protein